MLEKTILKEPLEWYTVILEILHNYLILFGVPFFQWLFYFWCLAHGLLSKLWKLFLRLQSGMEHGSA